MKENNIPEHLYYTETNEKLSVLEELKKDFLTITDARCKVRVYDIIKMME